MKNISALISSFIFANTLFACSDAVTESASDEQIDSSQGGSESQEASSGENSAEDDDANDAENVESNISSNECDALDAVTPPASFEQMELWMTCFESEGWEVLWVCEKEFTDKSSSAHSVNRVCNNPTLSEAKLKSNAQLPVGAAAIKQLTSGNWYVEVKVAAESGSGDGWYWRTPSGGSQGFGNETSVSFCANCHAGAGNGSGLGDFVFEQIQKP